MHDMVDIHSRFWEDPKHFSGDFDRGLNGMLEGTQLPRLSMDKMERMFERDTLALLGIDAEPMPRVTHNYAGIDFDRPGENHYQMAFHLDGSWATRWCHQR